MKIYNNLFTYSFAKSNISNKSSSNPFHNNNRGDVVNFSAKKYDSETIVNPTNHCAYCGCKVYTEAQIGSIARELLSSKADRLHGKIKSVLEKLDGAKQSQEILLAKRIENEEEIKFFRDYLDASMKKSWLKGSAIFEQVYNMDEDAAYDAIVRNMHPLLATVDHVSPQNEDKDNHNSDVNLVEACWCCNHDLKKGSSFSEFYTMYPTVKNNMPPEKFQYAMSNLLDSSQKTVLQRLSATNMVKFLDRLFIQRTEAANYLDSIDFRISGCKSGIIDSIEKCRSEIQEKEQEIEKNRKTLAEMKTDPEYCALLKRIELNSRLDDIKGVIGQIRDRLCKTSNSVNELQNTKTVKNKKQQELTPEEKEAKLTSLKALIGALNNQIRTKEEQQLEIELQLEELDQKFPTVEIMTGKKNYYQSVVNAYSTISHEQVVIDQKSVQLKDLNTQESVLSAQIDELPKEDFNIDSYTEEQQALFNKYKDHIEARDFINAHPNGNNTKNLISTYAKASIDAEIEEMEKDTVIKTYNDCLLKKQLESKLQTTKKQIQEVTNSINASNKSIIEAKKRTENVSLEYAIEQINILSESIKRQIEKQNYVKLPQIISSIESEILLLNNTISDLQNKLESIDKVIGKI